MHWSIKDEWSWQITLPDVRVYRKSKWEVRFKKKKKMQVVPIIIDDLKWKTVYTSSEKHREPSDM